MKKNQEKILDLLPFEIEHSVISKIISSTPSQMEIWLQCYLGGKEASMAYSESYSLKLFGELDTDFLDKAYQIIISKHEGLRAVFSSDGAEIHILESIKTSLSIIDISNFSEEEKNKYIVDFRVRTGYYEFDLQKGPLHLLELIKLSDSEYLLTFTSHHIMFDGWSIVLFLSHLGLVYSQLAEGKEVFLPESHKLSEFVDKIENFSQSDEYKNNLKFWKQKLPDPVPIFDLPIDFQRPPIRDLKVDLFDFRASDGLMIKAKKFGIKKKISFNLLLLCIYELFLSQWSKKKDIILGMPIAGQPLMGSLNMIGHSVFLIPIRSIIDFELTFEEYLEERSKSFSEVLEHGAISFGELVQHLNIKRDISRIPLFPSIFNNSIGQERRIKFGSIEKVLISNPKAFLNFEIFLRLFGTIEDPSYEWTYNKSLFNKDSIKVAAQKFDKLLAFLVENPSLKLDSIKTIFEEEREIDKGQKPLILEGVLNEEGVVPPVVEMFIKTASIFPKKIAVRTHDTGITYEELNTKSNQLAKLLKSKGIKPGDFVGVYLERSNATILSIIAILKAGAAYLPIDVEIPDDRVIYMLKNSGAKYFITDQPPFKDQILHENRIEFTKALEESSNFSSEFFPVKTTLSSPMYIIYTSGSTGNPKGIVLTQKNLDYFIQKGIRDLRFTSDDILLGVTSVSFDVATLEILIPYLFGATVYMLDKFERKDPKQILSFLEAKRITKMFATPTHWQMMVNSGWSKPMPELTVLSAGEPLKKSLVNQIAPLSKEIFNLYGPSETTVFSTLKKVDSSEQQITIGKEIPGTKIYLVDKAGNLIENPNVSGELWIGGDAVGKSYLGLKELTEEKFIKNPFEEFPERLYKTGDLGLRQPNEEIQYLGRIDNQVKIRGYRIELGEIEQRILQFEEVTNSVVGTDDTQGFLSLRAYISLKEEFKGNIDVQEFEGILRDRLSKDLPEYMVPSDFCFVDDFKLTTSGKIDRKLLPRIKKGSKNELDEINQPKKDLDKFSQIEQQVYSIWSSVLDNKILDLDTDFFLAGGHSLLGVKLISLLEKEFNLKLTLITLFQYPTIRSFSLLIEKEKKDSMSDSLVLIKKGSPENVLCFVHGVGLNPIEINTIIENMDANQTVYGLQSPAVSGNSEAFQTIPEMARHFIEELDKSEIKGPYHLIGNSIGGLIVFEMAKQLIESNREIGFISMIDTIADYNSEKPKKLSLRSLRLIKKLGFEFRFLFNDIKFYAEYRKNYVKEKWFSPKKKADLKNDLSSRIRRIELINIKAWKTYELVSLDIDITLFLARRRTFYVEDFETLGWSRFTRSVEKFIMPGEHANMLKPPHGSEFTKVLQEKLNLFKKK